MNLFKKNLELLQKSQPSLALRVEREVEQTTIRVIRSKDGHPIPQVGHISLHSNYYPLEEASRSIIDFKVDEIKRPVIYGLGFGYHILELVKKYPNKSILIVEPLMSMFQAFMNSVDIEPFLLNAQFLISEPPPKIYANHDALNWTIYKHLPSIRISNKYFTHLEQAREAYTYININKLKILVINPYYGGSLPTAKYCVQALNSLGHQAESVQCDSFFRGYSSIKNITKNKNHFDALHKQFNHFMGQLIAAKANDFNPDIILSIAQAPLGPDAIQNLKTLNIPIVYWFVEDFRTIKYWKDIAPYYDYFFTIQRGQFFNELKSVGMDNYYYLPQGCLPEVHKKILLSETDIKKYYSDISFMGAGYYNRLNSLSRLLNHDFKIWGTEWILESPLGKRVQNRNERIDPNEITKIYNAGKINLNLHSSTYHSGVNPDGDFVNPRTFEISACGGFQLVDIRSELSELMNLDDEIVTFSSIDELCEKVNYFLNHQDEAKDIALKGKSRVLNEHTIQHRMHEMLIHVFTYRLDQLKEKVNNQYRDPVNYCIDEAGGSTSLGKYLARFRGESNFSIKTITDDIEKGKGDLNNEELLILMVDQIVKCES